MTKSLDTALDAVSKIGELEVVKAEHTPTPWKYDGDGFDSIAAADFGTDGYTVMSDDCDPVCEICDTGDDSISEANAALIVRACNAHDALVNALREAEIALCGGPNTSGLHLQINSALKLARGEE